MHTSPWPKTFEDFLKPYPVRSYSKGEIVVFQGEVPRHAYVIVDGIVKAYNLSLAGDEKPVSFYKDGDIFSTPWLFGKVPSSTYYFEAFSKKVSVYCVNDRELREFLKTDANMQYAMLAREVELTLSMTIHINALQQSRASDKLIYTLHFLAMNNGFKRTQDELVINMNITHQDLANLTGLTRETTAVELSKLKRIGAIDYGPHRPYVLFVQKLTSLFSDQYVKELTTSLEDRPSPASILR